MNMILYLHRSLWIDLDHFFFIHLKLFRILQLNLKNTLLNSIRFCKTIKLKKLLSITITKHATLSFSYGIDKCVYRACHVQAHDIFDTECVVSVHIHIFGIACFTVSKIKKSKHARLKHMTRLACRIKCVCVYMCLIRVNTCNTYKFNKFKIKLKKYIRKFRKK
jgi:hypothetical protein